MTAIFSHLQIFNQICFIPFYLIQIYLSVFTSDQNIIRKVLCWNECKMCFVYSLRMRSKEYRLYTYTIFTCKAICWFKNFFVFLCVYACESVCERESERVWLQIYLSLHWLTDWLLLFRVFLQCALWYICFPVCIHILACRYRGHLPSHSINRFLSVTMLISLIRICLLFINMYWFMVFHAPFFFLSCIMWYLYLKYCVRLDTMTKWKEEIREYAPWYFLLIVTVKQLKCQSERIYNQ